MLAVGFGSLIAFLAAGRRLWVWFRGNPSTGSGVFAETRRATFRAIGRSLAVLAVLPALAGLRCVHRGAQRVYREIARQFLTDLGISPARTSDEPRLRVDPRVESQRSSTTD